VTGSADLRGLPLEEMGDGAPVEAILLRRSYGLRNTGIALALVGWAATLPNDGDYRVFWFVFLGMTGLVLAILGGEGTPRSTTSSLDAAGVHANGKLVAARKDILGAWIERDPEGIRVQLDGSGFRGMHLVASTEDEAGAFLRALRLDPSRTALRFRPVAPPFAAIWGSIGGQLLAHSLVVGGHHPSFLWPFALSSTAFVVLWLAFMEELRIGTDGVLFAGPLRRRFVPFTDVIGAATDDRGLVMHTRTLGTFVRRMRAPAAEAAAEHIERALASLDPSSQDQPDPVRHQLRREGDVVTWLARLRAMANPASYRAAGFAGDSLWRVVDDPGATATERAAAAVVLGTGATPEERVRLLDAAARIVSPRVRVAVERAADAGDEEELVGALAALDEGASCR
jgi:hypothetical protein